MRPVYLRSTAGMLHPPEGDPSGLGIVLVPPFGWDDQSFFRPRRAWAAALAADGHAVLRIDLPGTGDAAGGPRDPGLVDAWRAAIADAVDWLGTPRSAIAALGLGGLLSLGVAVDDLILWGVPASGRAYLRELKAFGRLEAAQTGAPPGDGPERTAGGHLLSAETAAAVGALDAAALAAQAAPARALLLGRDGVPPDARLAAALRDAGTEVETGDGDGWGAAAAGPQHAEVPHATIARTRTFLRGVRSRHASTGPGPATDALDLPGVRETPLRVGACFGVLAEPTGPRGDVTAVLLNAGAIRHIGPNRMWVEAARRWAAAGTPTLRIDLEAIGEADGALDPYGDDATFYTPALTAQVAPVLDALAARGLPDRFLLAGLCSGGYWAVHAAADDPRVATVVLLNPRLLFWDAEAGSRRELRRAFSVLTPSGFRALLTAERPFARLLAVLRYLLSRPFRRTDGPPETATHELVTRLRGRGQRIVFAFSGNEPLHDELIGSGDDADLEIHPLPFISHTLKPQEAQRAAHAVLDRALEQSA